jgi:manganese transport protein
MEGFLDLRIAPWLRRLITRLIAIIPAFFITWIYGESKIGELLVFSQVILSMQLSFAVIPLVMFTGDKQKMGKFANTPLLQGIVWVITAIILGLNMYLLAQVLGLL